MNKVFFQIRYTSHAINGFMKDVVQTKYSLYKHDTIESAKEEIKLLKEIREKLNNSPKDEDNNVIIDKIWIDKVETIEEF